MNDAVLGSLFVAACREVANWPLPGQGSSMERFRLLAAQCRADVALGRLVEAHADALAILGELVNGDAAAFAAINERRWGVWAAGPAESIRATRQAGHWTATGTKLWCSGASLVTHALIDAATDAGQQLFAVDLAAAGVSVRPSAWVGAGMARTALGTMHPRVCHTSVTCAQRDLEKRRPPP